MNKFKSILFVLLCYPCFGQNWFQSQLIERQFNQAVAQYNEGRFATSESILNKILAGEPGSYNEASLLLLIKSQIGLNRVESARETSRTFFTQFPESAFMKNVMESLGDLYVNEGNYSSAYRMYHRAKKLSNEDTFSGKIDSKILRLIQIQLPKHLLDELLTLEVDPEIRNIHLMAKANFQISSGHPDDAALTLNQVNMGQFQDTYFPFYENLLRASYEPPNPVTMVGIILPLSGDQSEIGQAFLSGFYDGEKPNNISNQRLSILIQDNRSHSLESIKVAKKLVQQDQLLALICPLDPQTSLVVASALTSTDIPIILTTLQQNDLSEINPLVFQINSTVSMQGKAAAQYAMKVLELDSLAVIAPADFYGETQTDAFIKEVDRLGGTVVATEWYSGPPKNLKRQFKNFRRVAFSLLPKEESFDEALGMEIDSLDALFDISAEDFFDLPKPKQKRITSLDSTKIVLNTIQGIYLPINIDDLEYIGPQLPMYNLNAKIIGNENWQDKKILRKDNIGPHLKDLSIITNFNPPSNDSTGFYGDLLEAYYDGLNTAHLLTQLPLDSRSRKSMSQSLQWVDIYSGQGFYYSPDPSNPHVNAAFQILEFNGKELVPQGVFIGDSLRLVPSQYP
ncbi:MAG: penicillin-binding protein activator [Candidatus Marinimicrobia bacterium]|nr:penicillin-binding protein activator [Candidatus Neomarinimicrobiota bacterium]MBL7030363.1 penicillin-binding protein activator [Candidatus Neomarinimicrobiota bacterium]